MDFILQIISSFGITGALGVGVFACLVWLLAHVSAAPGTQVSILWGLASYTKNPSGTVAKKPVEHDPFSREAPAAKTTSSVSRSDDPDYQAGRALRVIEDEPSNALEGTKYIRVTAKWRAGVADALEGRTTQQKDREIAKLVATQATVLEGDVSDFDGKCLTFDAEDGPIYAYFDTEDGELRDRAASFHKGDRIEMHAFLSQSEIGFHLPALEHPLLLKRIVKPTK